ncbi:hypothetical protein M9H77_14974 [Catharanthus roseus]|uniref:Uncharacterized protein n=1 Tax=Catharanthus roseus TaxID=4058 RepID=A0ACC0BPQ3_CATRO|nr:hypothetical protein M9H77_14974 [Catharanthus roseus]
MGGFDDHVAIMGDWMPPSPSPRTLLSMLGDDVGSRSISDPIGEKIEGFSFPGPQEYMASTNADEKNGSQAGLGADEAAKFSGMYEQKMSSRGGLLERRAARAGFNAPRLNTESIRAADLLQNQEVRSPYLTIPPGLSPTTLLDSPVFVNNSLVQPSPTTGKFQFVSNGNSRSSTVMTEFPDKSRETFFGNINPSSFAFRPMAESGPSLFFGTSNRVNPTSLPQQSFPSIEVSVQSQNVHPSSLERPNTTALNQQADFSKPSTEKETGVSNNNIASEPRTLYNVGGGMDHSPPLDEQQDEDADQRSNGDPNIGGAPAEDGYNWRKYGQKQVKGSEYPRSYYKCTHQNCQVKKKVERSQEGHITEIIYKGAHNHPKPPPNRRSALGSSNALSDMQLENSEQAGTGADGDPLWANVQRGNGASEGRNDNPEVTSSAMMGSEYCNGANSLQAQNGSQFETGDAVDASSTFSNDEEDDDRATHGSVSLGYDGEGDESESKRRKIETYPTDMSGASRAIREPRVVVQTTSEVDILDDGYRWRKYGQKVVKGNPNPRSYYKCTSAGCTVRKHVERASHDLKSVITTYEGKHNHDVPAARNSSHVNSGGASCTLPTQPAAVQTQVHRPEPSSQLHNSMTQFERPSSLASFALPGRPPLGPPNHHHGFGFGINQHGLSNLGLTGLGHNQIRIPSLPVHQYLGQQPRQPMNDMGLMLPKGEPKVEPVSDPGLNHSNGSSVYHQVMHRMQM